MLDNDARSEMLILVGQKCGRHRSVAIEGVGVNCEFEKDASEEELTFFKLTPALSQNIVSRPPKCCMLGDRCVSRWAR